MTTVLVEWALSWLWQGCLLALAVGGVLRLATGASATTRFLVWWAALAAVLVLGIAPLTDTLHPPATSALDRAAPATRPTVRPNTPPPAMSLFPVAVPAVPAWVGLALAAAWCGFIGARSSLLVLSLRRLQSIKGSTVSLPEHLEGQLPLWREKRGSGRTADLRLSPRVATAGLLGLGSPIIALPQRLVDSISRADLDRVVMHEYGHVQRRDDWWIMVQASVEAVCGWHPAIWWIGRQLHLEREVAADDWVTRQTSRPHEYASCLARVAELALADRQVVHCASAVRSRRELSARVDRLLNAKRNVTARPSRLALGVGLVALGGTVWLLGLAPSLVSATGALGRPAVEPPQRGVRVPLARVDGPVPVSQDVAWTTPPSAPPQFDVVHSDTPHQIQARSLALGDQVYPPRFTTRLQSPLQSTVIRIAHGLPVSPVPTRPLGLQTDRTEPNDDGSSPWTRLANVGKAVGIGATEAGQATASAFQVLGSRFTRVFGGD